MAGDAHQEMDRNSRSRDSILGEALCRLMPECGYVPIREAFICEIAGVKLLNGGVGFCYSDRFDYSARVKEWIKRYNRPIIMEDLVLKDNLELRFGNGDTIGSSKMLLPLYVATIAALSSPYLHSLKEKFPSKSSVIPVPRLPPLRRKLKAVQIGYDARYLVANASVNSLESLYLFDKYYLDRTMVSKIDKLLKSLGRQCAIRLVNGRYAGSHKIIRECDCLYITGSALANGTMDALLSQTKKECVKYVYCNGGAIIPELFFKRGVDFVHTSVFPDRIFDLVYTFANFKRLCRLYYNTKNMLLVNPNCKIPYVNFDARFILNLQKEERIP